MKVSVRDNSKLSYNVGMMAFEVVDPRETPEARAERYRKNEGQWRRAMAAISSFKLVNSVETLELLVIPVLPDIIRKNIRGFTAEERLKTWATTPINAYDHEGGLAINSKDGTYISETARMQAEFTAALRKRLRELGVKI